MNKTIIALSLALAASAGAFTSAAFAEDAFQITPSTSQPQFVAGVVTDLDANKGIEAQSGNIDYTATASVDRNPMSEQKREFLYEH